MIQFETPPYENPFVESRIYAENEASALKAKGYKPDELCREFSRTLGISHLEGGNDWRTVKLALMLEKLGRDKA